MNGMRAGFTIVELLAVIALVGILMTLSIGRLMNVAYFDEILARDRILATARGAQQLSFVRDNVRLSLTLSGTNFSVASSVAGVADTATDFSSSKIEVTAGTIGVGAVCTAISSTITLDFDSAGEIADIDSDGFPICLNGENSLCISPSGFAHAGPCL